MYLAAKGKPPYFFDPNKIESYDEPIFTNIDKQLIVHYEAKKSEIQSLKRDLIFLPDNEKLSVEFKEGSNVSIVAKHKGGMFYSSDFDYKSKEKQKKMQKIGITSDVFDRIKQKLEKAGCFSFEKKQGMRLGIKKGKSGTFYYRFNNFDDPIGLQDSCLIMKIDDQVYLEYSGSGRGPDCVVNKNPEGYDDRNLFQKWIGLIWNRKVVFE